MSGLLKNLLIFFKSIRSAKITKILLRGFSNFRVELNKTTVVIKWRTVSEMVSLCKTFEGQPNKAGSENNIKICQKSVQGRSLE